MLLKTKVVLVTSGQPSLNPRLVKEADALFETGYDVTVIYQYWNKWGTTMDNRLLPQKKWKAIRVGGSPSDEKLTYWATRLTHKMAQFVAAHLFRTPLIDFWCIGRCTKLLLSAAKFHKADLYIGHNLSALPAVVGAAKKNKGKSGFDAEDFHRQEITDNFENPDYQLKARLEHRFLPYVDYLTVSSPEIAKQYKKLFPKLNPITILNVFNFENNKRQSPTTDKNLKLVWFSQTIGHNRGLRDILEVMNKIPSFELHLLGFHDLASKKELGAFLDADERSRLFFYSPIPSTELISFCSQFDVGLALEPGFSFNNNIALSNKIFTYLTAGLTIIASDTLAQKNFFEQYVDAGMVYQRNQLQTLEQIVTYYINNPILLVQQQEKAKSYAKHELNWTNEREKLLTIVKNTLNS